MSCVVTPAERSEKVMASSHNSTDPHGRHRKSRDPTKMSCRAGIQGKDPVW